MAIIMIMMMTIMRTIQIMAIMMSMIIKMMSKAVKCRPKAITNTLCPRTLPGLEPCTPHHTGNTGAEPYATAFDQLIVYRHRLTRPPNPKRIDKGRYCQKSRRASLIQQPIATAIFVFEPARDAVAKSRDARARLGNPQTPVGAAV